MPADSQYSPFTIETPPSTDAVVGDGDDASTSVVLAVAAELGVDPLEMGPRLHDRLDPDALDALVETMTDGHVEFTMADRRVRVDADGRISVE